MQQAWDRRRAAAIAVGGATGAALRWAVVTTVEAGRFPWPVLAINVAGSILLGVLLAEEWTHPLARLLLHDAGGIGLCGGFTTFSAFSVEVVELARGGEWPIAAVYAVASVTTTIGGALVGAIALGRRRALSLPLEEKP